MQLKTLGKCRFRPSEGFVNPKIFWSAPRQLMVAFRLETCITIFHTLIFFSLIEKVQTCDPYFKAGYMQLKTLGKCHFRPSGGFVKAKIFLYAPRQLMVALRLDSLPGAQFPIFFFVPPRLRSGSVILPGGEVRSITGLKKTFFLIHILIYHI